MERCPFNKFPEGEHVMHELKEAMKGLAGLFGELIMYYLHKGLTFFGCGPFAKKNRVRIRIVRGPDGIRRVE